LESRNKILDAKISQIVTMVKQERDKQKADLNNLKVVNEELKEEIIKLQNKVKEQSKIEANESLKLDFEKKNYKKNQNKLIKF